MSAATGFHPSELPLSTIEGLELTNDGAGTPGWLAPRGLFIAQRPHAGWLYDVWTSPAEHAAGTAKLVAANCKSLALARQRALDAKVYRTVELEGCVMELELDRFGTGARFIENRGVRQQFGPFASQLLRLLTGLADEASDDEDELAEDAIRANRRELESHWTWLGVSGRALKAAQ